MGSLPELAQDLRGLLSKRRHRLRKKGRIGDLPLSQGSLLPRLERHSIESCIHRGNASAVGYPGRHVTQMVIAEACSRYEPGNS